ncbi:DHA2 family efflux MFS transporter permease subunit [Tsukamurella sp. 8F]|uniref:DHA2 family efflux MFS transporter permease subunit n=1 Tax=unclassified Tsukamurella TaxID=2633480 RepID=UPI0023B8CD83|nr:MULTISPECIES: DHA2 family efflux MFS transporter permease subunit [unclassified Tsukamurella]MDF0529682.1 DHA2 family efflux MFS transporter permease subunit [Tsukamurella sp. 8J]MDF0585967.1 DHA2 family efflux MFS transporter permease subunit [Tsukamurella sp. 8F]
MTATPTRTALEPSPRLGFVLVALGVGAIASILDSTIVNVAIDHLATVFHAGLASTQWVITGFLLAMAAVVPLSGWLMDRIGARRTWILALSVFLAGSVLCGAAWNLPSLIVFRVLQGTGAGLILPVLMALMTREAGRDRLMTAMGGFSLIVQVGPVLGPVVGGALIEGADWRWMFLANIPFCIAGMLLAPRALQPDPPQTGVRRLDAVGAVLLAPAMVALVYAFARIAPGHGLSQPDVWIPAAAALVLVAGFIGWSLHAGDAALIDVRLFARRGFALTNLISIALGFTMFGGMLLLPLYFQVLHRSSVLQAGLLMVPQGIGAAAVILGGKRVLAPMTPRARMVLGFAVMAMGTVPFAIPSLRDATPLLMVALTVRGAGIGLATPTLNALAVADLAPTELARGTTAFNIVQRIGAPFGTTVLAVVLANSQAAHPATFSGHAAAFATAFWWSIGATVIPIVLAAMLPGRRPPRSRS